MSNSQSQSILTGGVKEAQERFTLSGDPRYQQTFLDYDTPFDPYALEFWSTNADLQIEDDEATEEHRISVLDG
jgi:hypothetical protein